MNIDTIRHTPYTTVMTTASSPTPTRTTSPIERIQRLPRSVTHNCSLPCLTLIERVQLIRVNKSCAGLIKQYLKEEIANIGTLIQQIEIAVQLPQLQTEADEKHAIAEQQQPLFSIEQLQQIKQLTDPRAVCLALRTSLIDLLKSHSTTNRQLLQCKLVFLKNKLPHFNNIEALVDIQIDYDI